MWFLGYCLIVFVAVLGVIQLAALRNNFRGLLFFRQKALTVIFSAVTIVVPLLIFFTWYDFRTFLIEGSQQTVLFVVSAAAAITFSMVCSSLLNFRCVGQGKSTEKGLEALRESTFFQAVKNHRQVDADVR
jgi:hypothetical protein